MINEVCQRKEYISNLQHSLCGDSARCSLATESTIMSRRDGKQHYVHSLRWHGRTN